MTTDPVRHFLGVDGWSDPATLLGLPPGTTAVVAIESALHERLGRVLSHPDGRGPGAEQVRRRLRAAARALRNPPAGLTEFDRMVMAVLIGSGGWNAESRSRLVGLAGAYGVSVEGLLKVVIGLCDHARHGARVEPNRIAGGERRIAAPAVAATQGDVEWLIRLAPELRERTPASTFRLSLLFGLITLLLALLAIHVLFRPAATTPTEGPAGDVAVARPTPPSGPGAGAGDASPAPSGPVAAQFASPPTFLGHALTAEVAAAADRSAALPREIDLLARRITVAGEPSDAVLRAWSDALQTIGSGWVLVSESVRDDIDKAIFDTLYAASDSPSATDRLLAGLIPPSRPNEPADVWRGAWMAGALALVASSRELSPAVVERARSHLDQALDAPEALPTTFRAAASTWLTGAGVQLADGIEQRRPRYDLWESWIAAQRRLDGGDRFETAMMDAIDAVLASSSDLARMGPAVDILGRLADLADFESSAVVRDRFCAIVEAEGDRISSEDLWVLTSILAVADTAPWFSEDLVLPPDADWMHRRRTADRIRGRWPRIAPPREEAGAVASGPALDAGLVARWLGLLERQDAQTPGADDLERLVAACRLNEAAALIAAGETRAARGALDRIADLSPGRSAASATPTARGEPMGPDGALAVQIEEVGHNNEEMLNLMSRLRLSVGTDLGPIDAEAFVQIVYRGPRRDIREQARAILIENLADGPNVALEMLGQLPSAPRSEAISDVLQRYTGRLLPGTRSEPWAAETREALVDHALRMLGSPGRLIDGLAEQVAESYAARRDCLAGSTSPQSSATPARAAEGLLDAWRQRARAASVGSGAMAALDRRHATRLQLADGPIQRFVAAQLTALDMAGLVTATERPWLDDEIRAVTIESAARRSRVPNVLGQSLEIERAIGRLWRLALERSDA